MGNIRNVRRISKEKGISYAFICKKIGRSHGYLSEIESRDADVPRKSVPLIAEALGVSEEEITGKPLTSSQKIDDLIGNDSAQQKKPTAQGDGLKLDSYEDIDKWLDTLDGKGLDMVIAMAAAKKVKVNEDKS